MKKILTLFALLFIINSQAQIEFIGETIESTTQYYDSIVYQSQDTLVVIGDNGEYINYICDSNIIQHAIKILPLSDLFIIEESLSTMIESNGKYFFEYDEGLYCMYIIELESNDYFGLYLGRIE